MGVLMKMLKTLLVSVLFVAQVSAMSTSDTRKARLAASIRNLELNLGILKKKPQPQKTMISKIGNTIKNNKGKIALGVGLITLGVLAYKNPAVVVNGFNSVVGTAKNFLFGKVQPTQIAQPMTPISTVAENLFAPTVNNFVQPTQIAQPMTPISTVAENLFAPTVNNFVKLSPKTEVCYKVLPNGIFSGTSYKEICLNEVQKQVLDFAFGVKTMKRALNFVNGFYGRFVR